MSPRLGAGIAVLAIAAAAALFVVLRDDDPEPAAPPVAGEAEPAPGEREAPAEPEIPEIVIRDGRPVGEVTELSYRRGDRVRFAVRSDADDEVHVHGYDILQDVEAGERAVIQFRAELDGVFEVELHDVHVEIARLTIRP